MISSGVRRRSDVFYSDSFAGDSNDITFEQWMIVLKLLTMWRFSKGTQNVLERLKTSADPITKILLCQQYKLDEAIWLIPSVEMLARRAQPLSVQDGIRLGLVNVLRIAEIRESYSCCCGSTKWYRDHWRGDIEEVRNCDSRENHSFSTYTIKNVFSR